MDKAIAFLLNNGADENAHSGRNLLDHLLGTAEILRSWDCDEDVVLAGLFHSVYGTESYHTQTISYDSREQVKEVIGKRAEQLAYEFGSRNNRFISFIQNNETDLILIECANLIEQKENPSFLAITTVVDLPVKAKTTITNYLQSY